MVVESARRRVTDANLLQDMVRTMKENGVADDDIPRTIVRSAVVDLDALNEVLAAA